MRVSCLKAEADMNTFSQHAKHLATQSILLLLLVLTTIGFSGRAFSADDGSSRYYSDAQLAQMLAPIALYPDALLTHVLIASTYPLEVVEAQRWRKQHQDWSDNQLTNEGAKQGWDPSVVALLAFPNILDKMSQDLNWTSDLGEAFVADEGRVMDSIQDLRQAAYAADSLKNVSQIQAKRENDRIIIVPADPQVIWVPYYDPRLVYGTWRWSAYPPFYWDPFPGYVIAPHSLFYWRNGGIQISFNFFFSTFRWHERTVWVDYHHTHYRYVPYRSSISSGSQRWVHRPEHRRGVHYRHESLQQRYEPKYHRDDNRYQQVQHSLQNRPQPHDNKGMKRSFDNREHGLTTDNKKNNNVRPVDGKNREHYQPRPQQQAVNTHHQQRNDVAADKQRPDDHRYRQQPMPNVTERHQTVQQQRPQVMPQVKTPQTRIEPPKPQSISREQVASQRQMPSYSHVQPQVHQPQVQRVERQAPPVRALQNSAPKTHSNNGIRQREN